MSHLWKVYRNNQIVGVMDAAEIRQSLRDGLIDPFDHVSRDGSSVRVQLIEVDEIFEPDGGNGGASPTGEMLSPQRNAPAKHGDFSRQETFPPSHQPKPIRNNAGINPNETPKSAKKFYLIDRHHRVLGPLSAAEIQSLFFRGVLDKSVRVQKMGAQRMIPVRQFVQIYAGQRMNAITQKAQMKLIPSRSGRLRRGGSRIDLASSTVLNELTRVMQAKSLVKAQQSPLFLLAFGVLLGVLVFVIAQTISSHGDSGNKRSEIRGTKREEAQFKPRPATVSGSQGQLVKKARSRSKTISIEAPQESVVVTTKTKPSKRSSKASTQKRRDSEIKRPATKGRSDEGQRDDSWADTQKELREQARSFKKADTRKAQQPNVRPLPAESRRRVTPVDDPERALAPPPLARRNTVRSSPLPASRPKTVTKPVVRLSRAPAPPPVRSPVDPLDAEFERDVLPAVTAPRPEPVSSAREKARQAAAQRAAEQARMKAMAARTAPVPPPPPARPAPQAPSLDDSVGNTVTLGPLRFNPALLDQCGLKCKLPTQDASGRTITLVFFKEAFLSEMIAKGGRVTVSGRLNREGGGFSLLLQDVK